MMAQERTPTPPQPFDQEPQPYYAGRLLQHALSYGISDFGLEQAEQADRAAMQATAALPVKLDADAARLDQALHDTRHRLAAHIARHRQARARFSKLLAELYRPADDLERPQASPDGPQESDADRATRLLRAALMLIMDPKSGQGGDGAKLIKPTPSRPPSAGALTPPTMAPSGPRF